MSFTFNGFNVLPGKGMMLLLGFLVAMAVGLAYSTSVALQNSARVGDLHRSLKAAEGDLQALRGIVQTQRAQAVESARNSAHTQEQLKNAQARIRSAGSRGTAAERVRNARDEAQRAIEQVSPVHGPSGSVPGKGS